MKTFFRPCWYSLECPGDFLGDFSGFPRLFEMKLGLREGSSSNPELISLLSMFYLFYELFDSVYFSDTDPSSDM